MKYRSKPLSHSDKSKLLLLITFVFTLIGCGQDFNTNSGDKPVTTDSQTVSECGSSDSETGFCAARLIYQTNCFSCHPGWAEYETQTAWADAGLVIPGDINNSPAINRLINYGSDMPLNGSALSEQDYQTLIDWVQSITN